MTNSLTIDLLGNNDELNKALEQSAGTVDEFVTDIEKVEEAFNDLEDDVKHLGNKVEDEFDDMSDDMQTSMKEGAERGGGVLKQAMSVAIGNLTAQIIGGVTNAFGRAFDMAKNIVTEAFDSFSEQRRAEARLDAVLQATGEAAGFTGDQMRQMAVDMQEVTGIADQTVLGMQAVIATFKNVRGDQFKETMELAADMAVVLESDVKGAAIQVAKALNDPLKGMSALAESGVSFTEQQRQMVEQLLETGDVIGAQKVILEELKGEFGGAAERVRETGTGLEGLRSRLDDVYVAIAEALIPVLDELKPVLDAALDAFENSIPILKGVVKWAITVAKNIVDVLVPAVEFLAEAGVYAFTVLETAVENWRDIMIAAANAAALGIVSRLEDIKHMIGVVIPDLLVWFADNWQEIFIDIANFMGTILNNIWKNILDFWDNIKKLFNDEDTDFKFKGLTEGFKSALKELPQIAERELSPLEVVLKERLDKVTGRINDSFEANLEKNSKVLDFLKGLTAPGTDQAKVDLEDTASEVYDLGATAQEEEAEETTRKESRQRESKRSSNEDNVQARIENLTGLSDRITAAAASLEGSDPQLEEQQRTNAFIETQIGKQQEQAEKQQAALEVIADNTGKQMDLSALGTIVDRIGELGDVGQALLRFIPGVGALR